MKGQDVETPFLAIANRVMHPTGLDPILYPHSCIWVYEVLSSPRPKFSHFLICD